MENHGHTTNAMLEAWHGDSAAKEEFFRRIKSRVAGILKKVRSRYPGAASREPLEADFNELWLRLVEAKLGKAVPYRDASHFCATVYRAAINLLIDRLRRADNQIEQLPVPGEARCGRDGQSTPGVVTALSRNEELAIFEVAISQLSPEEFLLYGHIYLRGLKKTEAFRQLGWPEATGRDRLLRMTDKIAKHVRQLLGDVQPASRERNRP